MFILGISGWVSSTTIAMWQEAKWFRQDAGCETLIGAYRYTALPVVRALRPWLMYPIILHLAFLGPALALPNFTIYGSGSGLTGDVVNVMAANTRDIWVNSWYPTTGGATGGISTFSYKYENWTTYGRGDGLAADVLQGLGIAPDNSIWICHPFGVQVFDPAKGEFVADYGVDDGLKGAAEDVAFQGGDTIWVGTTEGVAEFTVSTRTWRMYNTADGLVHNKVYSLALDGDALWIGTGGGASRFDTASSEWASYTTADGLPDDIVNKVFVTGKDVWFATRSGLARMKKGSGKIRVYTKADGLPSDNIVDVAVFRDRIWVATSEGVGKLEGRWKIVDKDDGLPVTKVSSIATQRDYIWFGTPSGVARYGPLGPGLSFTSPYFLIIILAVAGGAVLLVLRPGARKAEPEATERKARSEGQPLRKPPHEICGGAPKRRLCTRCKYYTLRSGAIRCAKYDIPIDFKEEGEGRLKQIKRSPPPDDSGDEDEKTAA